MPDLDRLTVVLVRARNPSNIGAVARAMHDFGFRRLRVVNEYPVPFEAAKSAVDASAVLEAAESYSTVAEAVADCTLVIGTTAVGERDLQHPLFALADAAPRMRGEMQRGGGVALLFGSEKTGLSNDELSHCNWLLTIPMHAADGARHVSMNLGQAAAVCLYELVRREYVTEAGASEMLRAGHETKFVTDLDWHDGQRILEGAEPATAGQLERVSALLTEVMEATEYSRRHAHNFSAGHIRRLVRRMGADATDAPVWIGILKQILWKLGAPPKG